MTKLMADEVPPGSIERWAHDYITATTVEAKLTPRPAPEAFARKGSAEGHSAHAFTKVAPSSPGRPAHFSIAPRAPKTPGPIALREPRRRATLLHAFLHHEVQAAELFAWALLAFPTIPVEMRRGLVALVESETRHAALYAERLGALGFAYGDFPVRDWFWLRVPSAATPSHFVATLGIGLEGANLDHALRFAAMLRAAGDPESARIQEVVGREEVAHVRFARRWFEHFEGEITFEKWRSFLPAPLSPMVMRGPALDAGARERAGLNREFVVALQAFQPEREPMR